MMLSDVVQIQSIYFFFVLFFFYIIIRVCIYGLLIKLIQTSFNHFFHSLKNLLVNEHIMAQIKDDTNNNDNDSGDNNDEDVGGFAPAKHYCPHISSAKLLNNINQFPNISYVYIEYVVFKT